MSEAQEGSREVKGSRLVTVWFAKHAENAGCYAGFQGFEEAMRASSFGDTYDELDIYDQIALFGAVVDLLVAEAEEGEP